MTTRIGSPPPTADELLHVRRDWLHLEHFEPAQRPTAVVVFTHGFSAYAAPYRHVAHAWAQAGYAATLYDVRGHGHSTGRRGYVRRFADYVFDLRRVVSRARGRHPGVPLVLVGHSQGGAIVLDFLLSAAKRPQRLRAALAVLAAPMLEIVVPIPWYKRLLLPIGERLAPTYQTSNGITAEIISRVQAVRRGFERDPLVHHVATPRWFEEVDRATRRLRASPQRLQTPTLLLTAGTDRVVSAAAQTQFAAAAPPGLVEQRTYEALYHEMFVEPERDAVIGDMLSWMRQRLASAEALASGRPAPGLASL